MKAGSSSETVVTIRKTTLCRKLEHNLSFIALLTSSVKTHLVDSNGYVINLGSKGISGSVLQYLTLHTNSDLKQANSN
jgi:hypothetical protein